MILLDTNVIARYAHSPDPKCPVARLSIHRLKLQGEDLILVPQNLYEFWSVATRKLGPLPSGENGLGMTCNQTAQWIGYYRRQFRLLSDAKGLADRWLSIVHSFGIPGTRSYDARLVAAMQTHKITRLLTFDVGDFKRFPITVIDPASV